MAQFGWTGFSEGDDGAGAGPGARIRSSSSSTRSPVNDSMTGGTCAMTRATSLVIFETPVSVPLPVLIIVMRSIRESGSATAFAISGRIGAMIWRTAASPYSAPRLGLLFHGERFGKALRLPRFGLRETARFRHFRFRDALRLGHGRRRHPPCFLALRDHLESRPLGSRLGLDARTGRSRQRLRLVALRVGLPPDRRVQLLFLSLDLLLLNLDLHRLLLELVGHFGLGALPVRDALLLGDGLLCLEVRDLGCTVRSRVRFALAPLLVGRGLGHEGVTTRLGFLRELERLGLSLARFTLGIGLCDGRLLQRNGLRDRRRPLHLGDAWLAERFEIAVLVADVPNREGVDAEAHVSQIPSRDLLYLLSELVAILVDVLDAHRAENRAEMPLHRLERDSRNLLGPLPEEAFGRRVERGLVLLDLDLGDTVDDDRVRLATYTLPASSRRAS